MEKYPKFKSEEECAFPKSNDKPVVKPLSIEEKEKILNEIFKDFGD